MSTFWTPDGERPIRRDPPPQERREPPPAAGVGGPPAAGFDGDPEAEPTPEELQAHMQALQEQLAGTPAEVVIANHCFGLFELAALHLGLQPPQLDQAQLAIDGFAALVEGLAGRLGDVEPQLLDGLAQLRLAFVQLRTVTGG